MIDYNKKIDKEWEKVLSSLLEKKSFKDILAGNINPKMWGYIMVESGHLAKYNPQIQAYATMFFKGEQEKIVRSFLKHAISEIGHDELAYSDAELCGVPSEHNRDSMPIPETTALTALPLYLIQFESPLAYLGYLFFLEFLPTSMGNNFMDIVLDKGIPQEATTFLKDHAEIDIVHNKLMRNYIKKLILSDEDFNIVKNALWRTGTLYDHMITGSIAKYKDNI